MSTKHPCDSDNAPCAWETIAAEIGAKLTAARAERDSLQDLLTNAQRWHRECAAERDALAYAMATIRDMLQGHGLESAALQVARAALAQAKRESAETPAVRA